jgi:hypothetical protein
LSSHGSTAHDCFAFSIRRFDKEHKLLAFIYLTRRQQSIPACGSDESQPICFVLLLMLLKQPAAVLPERDHK